MPDSLRYNTFSNHGFLGVINTPSARFYDSPSGSFSFYRGDPDRRLNLTMYPYNWMEASLFYTSIKDKLYGTGISQDYKDKGFNIKLRLKEEGVYPAIAIGLNDFAGTGLYSSEYIVASYGISNFDVSLGLAWGQLNGNNDFKNPFIFLHDSFNNRITSIEDQGGQIQPSRYFSGQDVSIFSGINYVFSDSLILKVEYDSTNTPGEIGYPVASSNINTGFFYNIDKKFGVGLSFERGNYFSLNFGVRDFFDTKKKSYKAIKVKNQSKYYAVEERLAANNIGISEINTIGSKLDIQITENSYNNLRELNYVLDNALSESDFTEEVVISYKTAGLKVIDNSPNDKSNQKNIFKRQYFGVNQAINFNLKPFIASREDFLKLSLLMEHDLEFIFSENLFFTSNVKLALLSNFDDLYIPPKDIYPAQVRSDIKKYLNNIGEKPSIGRAQLDFFKTINPNNHILLTGGILEDMFSGYGFEYLWFNPDKRFSFGFESFSAYKRDYNFRFGLQDYKNVTSFINLFYRNDLFFDFTTKISFGEYLAGDRGATVEFSKRFSSGVEFGIFATFTNVTTAQYGEGSFDKGLFFTIPLGRDKNLSNFVWRPLTKDPGSKLVRKNNLYSMLRKYAK